MRKIAVLFAALLCSTLSVFSQVKGKVTDAKDGSPIAGATIKVKGERTTTTSRPDGTFEIAVKSGQTLEVTEVGHTTLSIKYAGSGDLDVKLVQDTKGLSEVVVTALGIKREKKALGYAVSTVGKKDLELRPEGDIARILNGKAPGVNILNSSGLSGSGTNITIRAIGSITGNASPLFVVDGVPFNSNTNANAGFTFGNQTSSRFLDLDPNNIENVSILKGLSATTLYGELGRNGVILVTTKNGTARTNKKAEITVSQSYFINEAANLPDYNRLYGGGFDLSNGVTFFSNWGDKFADPPVQVNHPYSRAALNLAFPEYVGGKYDFKYYNSVPRFFRKGKVSTTSINIGGAGLNANLSYMNDQGFTPGNDLTKINFGVGGTSKLSNNFTVSGSFNFVNTKVKAPPTSTSFGSSATNISVFGDVLYTPTSVDLMGLPFENPLTKGHVYYRRANDIQNPRWTLKNAFTEDNVNRAYGNIMLKYDFKNGINVSYRIGYDNYSETQLYAQNKGGAVFADGIMRTSLGVNTIWDQNFIVNYSKDLSSDWKLGVDAGYNIRNDVFKQTGVTSTQQLVFGLLQHDNFIEHNTLSEGGLVLDTKSDQEIRGAYLQGVLSYKEYLFFNVGGRKSWTSVLEKDNRSLLYPSGSVSFIPTSAIASLQNSKAINYLKIRAGYATSAEFPPPYSTRATLGIATKVFVDGQNKTLNANYISNFLSNLDLKPSLVKEFETGVEGKFFDNRISLDFTYYIRKNSDQLLDRDLDPSTGYDKQTINAGNVTNRGVEIALGITPVRFKNWRWQVDGLFSKNISKVTDLPSSLSEVRVAGYTNLGNFAVNGLPLGVIKGLAFQRAENGQKIVGSAGDYLADAVTSVLGDPNPKFKLTGISTLSYKGLSFRVQVDYTHGGDMYSATSSVLLGRGVTRDTEFDRRLPLILPGVLEDGKTPNNQQISATQAYFNNTVAGGAADEAGIYDATNIRIREASLTYTLPQGFLKNSPFGSVSVIVSGTNLWYYAPNFPKYVHFDPETSGLGVSNGKGLEFFTGPSSRRYGASIRLTF